MRRRAEDPAPVEAPFDAPAEAAAERALVQCRRRDFESCTTLMQLLSRLRVSVLPALMRRCAYHDAQDGIADALLGLYEEALAGTWRDPPRSWPWRLYWKARTCIFRERRHRRVIRTRPLRRSDLEIPAPGDPIRALIGRLSPLPALKRLTPIERRVVLARAEGLAYRQIADMGWTTAGSARRLFSTACEKLRKWCSREEAA